MAKRSSASSSGRVTAFIIVITLAMSLTIAFGLAACALSRSSQVSDESSAFPNDQAVTESAGLSDDSSAAGDSADDASSESSDPASGDTAGPTDADNQATTVADPQTSSDTTSLASPASPATTASSATQPTTPASTQPAAPVDASGPLAITNWTLTEQGTILWHTPAPKPIAYQAARTVQVTIPEGYTLVEICKILEKKGVQTFYHTFSAALNGDYPSYSFTDTSKSTPNRRYALEGYLFPDTYEFHVGEKPYNIFAKILSQTNAVLSAYQPFPGMMMDQVVTLASLIEEEAFTGETRANVSSVLHNRLASGQRLELDKSIHYVEWYIKPLIQSTSTTEINAYNSFYNTYKCPSLPAGPITNPGRLAIEAAINPANTTYHFFVTDEAGNYYFATTWEEHLANLKTAGLA